MINCPGYHRTLHRGERARATMLTSFEPATIKILPSRRFSPKRLPKRCQFQTSTISPQATERLRMQLTWKGPDADTTLTTLPSPNCRFESDTSLVLTASLVSLLLDRSKGSRHSQHGRQCRETRAHMKINLPIFKDKDAVTYQSWWWDLMVYHCVGCRDCTLLLYTIWSL